MNQEQAQAICGFLLEAADQLKARSVIGNLNEAERGPGSDLKAVIASEAKQCRIPGGKILDCFVASLLAMTARAT